MRTPNGLENRDAGGDPPAGSTPVPSAKRRLLNVLTVAMYAMMFWVVLSELGWLP